MIKISDFLDRLKEGDPDALVHYLDHCFDLADMVRRRFEPDWFSNIQYLAGNQWESYSSDIQRFARVDVKQKDTKVKLTVNRILPLIRQSAANIRETLNKVDAIPSTNETLDVEAAKIGTDLLDWRWDEDQEEEKTFHELLWTMTCGRMFRKTYWDPYAGREGLRGIGGEGDIVSESVNPFRLWPCPWAESSDWPPPWVIEADTRDIDWVEQQHDKKVQPESIDNARSQLDKLLVSVVDSRNSQYSNNSAYSDTTDGGTPQRKNSCVYKRMYVSPTSKNPNGRLLIWANKVLLESTELPGGFLPFVARDWLYIPGRQWPLPLITPLRPIQREYNITLSMLVELKNRQLRGDIVTSSNKGVDMRIDPLTGRRTYVVGLDQRWEQIRYDANVSEAEMQLARCVDDMREIAGVHEPTMGKTGARATTATQVNVLKESDQMGMALFRKNIDLSAAKIARQKLILAKENYKNQRVATVIGQDGAVKSSAFFGSDLRETYDVKVRTTTLMSVSVQAQMRLEATAQGLFGPYSSLEDELAKRTALIAMRIPGIEDEMADMMPMEELRKAVGQIRKLKAQLEINGLEAQKIGLDAQIEQLLAQPSTMPGVPGMDPGVDPELDAEEFALRQQAAQEPVGIPDNNQIG